MDMFGMMNDMSGNVEHMTTGANCQTFTSSTVISYSTLGDGAPKVYQETSEMRSAPGGIRETRRTVRDSDSGVHWPSHPRQGTHPAAFPKSPNWGPGRTAGLHQFG